MCELCFLDALPHGWPADFRPGLDWWRYECDIGYTIMRKRGNSYVYCPEGEVWCEPNGTWMAGDFWMGMAWPVATRAEAIRCLIPKGGHVYE